MRIDTIIALLHDIYIEGHSPHDSDPSLGERIDILVQELSTRIAEFTGTVPEVRRPANLDSYYLVSWPLRTGLPSDPYNIDASSLLAPALYLTARVPHFAPLIELSWLELGFENGKPYRISAELLDADVLERNPSTGIVASSAIRIAKDLGLEPLSWEFLRLLAPADWPREFWMPERPEIRNYLFPGFYETWPEPED